MGKKCESNESPEYVRNHFPNKHLSTNVNSYRDRPDPCDNPQPKNAAGTHEDQTDHGAVGCDGEKDGDLSFQASEQGC